MEVSPDVALLSDALTLPAAPSHPARLASSPELDEATVLERRQRKTQARRDKKADKRAATAGALPATTVYYFAHGQRHVIPYSHTYHATTKSRWFGRTIGEV